MSMQNIDDLDAVKALIETAKEKQYFMGYNSGYRQALLDIKMFLEPEEEEEEKSSPTLGDLLKQKIDEHTDDNMF